MEITSNTKAVLEGIDANNPLIFDKPAIQGGLEADALAYQGMGIKILTVAGGLLASLFFLGFLGTLFSSSKEVLVIWGAILIAAAVIINRTYDNLIVDTVCICCYLAGYAALGFGLERLLDDNAITLIVMVTALVVILITNGYMLNLFSAFIITGCLAVLININNAYQLFHMITAFTGGSYVLLAINEPRLLAAGKNINQRYGPFYTAMMLSFTIMLCFIAATDVNSRYFPDAWLSTVVIVALLLFTVFNILAKTDVSRRARILIFTAIPVIAIPVFFFPAVCGGILLLILGWHAGQRLAQVLGILVLIYATGMYYYNLGFTLLVKSGMMFGTGLILILVWLVLKKQLKQYEEV
jgi:hypothetical protein